MDTTKKTNPVLEGILWKEILLFFFPIFFGTFFQQLYNTIDALIVGRYVGKEALSAVAGSSGMIVQLVVGFFVGLASGASVLVSQYYGSRDQKNISNAVHTVMIFSVLCGAFIMILGILTAPILLQWMKTPEDTMELSILYLRIYFAGMIANLIYNTGSGILRAAGNSRLPLLILTISCAVNIGLDILFVLPLHMGIFGASLATVLAQLVSALMILYAMVHTEEAYHLQRNRLHMDTRILLRMIQIGLPAGLQSVMYGISNAIIQIGINGLGTDHVAAWATFYKIDGLFWMTVSAFGVAVTTFTGQNYGAGNRKRVNQSVRLCMLMATTTAIAITLLFYVICPWLFPLFTTDANVKVIGVAMMRYLTRFYFLYCTIEILSGALRGMGDTMIPMIISAVGACFFRSIWILFLIPENYTMYHVMYCYPISWIITSVLTACYYPFSKQVKKMRSFS